MSRRHQRSEQKLTLSKKDLRKLMRDNLSINGKGKSRQCRNRTIYVVNAPCAITRDFTSPVFFSNKKDALERSRVLRSVGWPANFEVWFCRVYRYTFEPELAPCLSLGGISKV